MPGFLDHGWALVEIMGHVRLAGQIYERVVAGTTMLAVDVPAVGRIRAFTRILGGKAIFGIIPLTEDEARAAAEVIKAEPLDRWLIETAEGCGDPDSPTLRQLVMRGGRAPYGRAGIGYIDPNETDENEPSDDDDAPYGDLPVAAPFGDPDAEPWRPTATLHKGDRLGAAAARESAQVLLTMLAERNPLPGGWYWEARWDWGIVPDGGALLYQAVEREGDGLVWYDGIDSLKTDCCHDDRIAGIVKYVNAPTIEAIGTTWDDATDVSQRDAEVVVTEPPACTCVPGANVDPDCGVHGPF